MSLSHFSAKKFYWSPHFSKSLRHCLPTFLVTPVSPFHPPLSPIREATSSFRSPLRKSYDTLTWWRPRLLHSSRVFAAQAARPMTLVKDLKKAYENLSLQIDPDKWNNTRGDKFWPWNSLVVHWRSQSFSWCLAELQLNSNQNVEPFTIPRRKEAFTYSWTCCSK